MKSAWEEALNEVTLYWSSPNKILRWVKFGTIQIKALGFESEYSATDGEFDIPNFELELQIPFFGNNSDAKSYLVHTTSSDYNIGDSWPRPMCWAPTEREESLWNS